MYSEQFWIWSHSRFCLGQPQSRVAPYLELFRIHYSTCVPILVLLCKFEQLIWNIRLRCRTTLLDSYNQCHSLRELQQISLGLHCILDYITVHHVWLHHFTPCVNSSLCKHICIPTLSFTSSFFPPSLQLRPSVPVVPWWPSVRDLPWWPSVRDLHW